MAMAQDVTGYLCLFVALLVLLKVVRKASGNGATGRLRLPPGPWRLPVIGNLHQVAMGGPLVHRTMADMARRLDAPLMSLRLGEIPVVVASSADAAREITKTHDVAFATRPLSSTIRVMVSDGEGLVFTPYGALWRRLRKIAMLELLSARRVQSFRRVREEEVGRLVAAVAAAAAARPGEAVNLSQLIAELISDTAARTIIGDRFEKRQELLEGLTEGIRISSGFSLGDLFPSSRLANLIGGTTRRAEANHRKNLALIECALRQHEERRAAGDEEDDEDLVDVLLRVQKEGGGEVPLTMGNVKVVIREMFGAGSETSANTLQWLMSELILNPRVMSKAQVELSDTLRGKQTVTEDDLAGLKYLKLIIKENLRLHPVVPLLLPRECQKTCKVMMYDVPVGTTVLVNVWSINRDPKYWEDPETFKPERFEDGHIDFKGTDFEFIPFGAGRRMCPGITFAEAIMELALASLLYHFDWKLLGNGISSTKLDMTEELGATVRRKNDLYLVPTIRVPLPADS